MQLHPFGHGGDLLTAAANAGLKADQILDFSANINPLGPPSGLYAYLTEAMPAITAYPDPACRALIHAIHESFRPKHHIVPGNGAGELIYLLMRVLPQGPVLMPAPTFTLYAKAAAAAGRDVMYHYLTKGENYLLNIEAYCEQIKQTCPAAAMLCNPNNPTGAGLTREDILAVASACKKAGAHLIVDEAFLEFHPDWANRTVLSVAPEHVIVLCSLTKFYAIPGLRLGFLSASQEMAHKVLALRDPWSVNSLAQLAGPYVLQDREYQQATIDAVQRLSQHLYKGLTGICALQVYPPTANYVFMEVKTMTARQLQERCLEYNVLIRDCSNYAGLGAGYFRVAVRLEEENALLLQALRDILT